MAQKITMVYDGEQPEQRPTPLIEGKTLLKHRQAFEVNEKTPKAQLVTIEGWNEMRQCLLDNGLMETK